MSIAKPGDKVLVTGANGYIAIWVVQKLLEKGYAVRGTVRSTEKGKHLEEYFKSYGSKFELAIVPDIATEGAFDEAVKGVDVIAHTASPFHDKVDDPKEFFEPAIKGTVGILQSALKNAPGVKRIVITSSTAAVASPTPTPSTFSEKDWNDVAVQDVEKNGRDAAPMTKYRASKTLAEKAAWDFYNQHKSEVQWDISVLNPPFVFGPPIHEVSSPSALNTSVKMWYSSVVSNETPKTRQGLATPGGWIDVRDLADAHVLALETEAAGGERIIVASGSFVMQEWLDVANSIKPSPIGRELPTGFSDIEHVYLSNYDTSKAAKIFGIKYRSKEDTTRDSLADFAKRGW